MSTGNKYYMKAINEKYQPALMRKSYILRQYFSSRVNYFLHVLCILLKNSCNGLGKAL